MLAWVEGLLREGRGKGNGDGDEISGSREMGECCVGDFGLGEVPLEDKKNVDHCGFNNVNSEVRDMEVEDWEKRYGYGDVGGEEQEVISLADTGK